MAKNWFPRVCSTGLCQIMRRYGVEIPEFTSDEDATSYYSGSGGPSTGDRYLNIGLDPEELRVWLNGQWTRQIAM